MVNGYTAYTYGPIVLARDNKKEQIKDKPSLVDFDLAKAKFSKVK